MQEGDYAFRHHGSVSDSACLTHHLADEGDPFASANQQHRSSELLVSARKSPELSVPNANQ